MKRLLLVFGILGCVFSASAQQTNETIDINGTTRDYIQYLPVGFNQTTESLPVVFVLHGIGGTASGMTVAGTNLIADTARFICVYPQGMPNFQGNAAWNNGTLLESTADDLGLFHALIDQYILDFNADPSRIYVTGLSMGSIMSYTLACQMNDRIAAIGCMSGPMSTEDLNSCAPTYITPVIHIHGTNDQVVPYDSNPIPSLSLVPETMDFWANQHACTSVDSTQIPNTANDGLTVDRFVYQGCTPSESVELWRVNGGEHTYFYEPLNDFTEAIEIWLFFRKWQHSNPAPAGLSTLLIADKMKVHPNPSNGTFTLTAPVNEIGILHDVNGKEIQSISLNEGENSFDLSNLKAGIYFLKFNDGSAKRIAIK